MSGVGRALIGHYQSHHGRVCWINNKSWNLYFGYHAFKIGLVSIHPRSTVLWFSSFNQDGVNNSLFKQTTIYMAYVS